MTILPFPLWPLAEHAMFGQNGFDASLGSVFVCINDSMPMGAYFFKSSFPFHRLVESYPTAEYGWQVFIHKDVSKLQALVMQRPYETSDKNLNASLQANSTSRNPHS